MIGTKLLDSSIWLAYFFEGNFSELIETDETFCLSALSIFEIKKKMLRANVPLRLVQEKLSHIKSKSIIFSVDDSLAENAVEISIKHKMPMADSIIYATAIVEDAKIFTLDNHFRGLERAEVLS